MKLTCTIFFIAIAGIAAGQQNNKLAFPVKKVIGRFEDGRLIQGTTFYWTEDIRELKIDTAQKEIILHLADYKNAVVKVAVFDVQNDSFKWSRSFSPEDAYSITVGRDDIYYNYGRRATCYGRATGNMRWHLKEPVPFADANLPAALGKNGRIFDASTGEVKSNRNIRNRVRYVSRISENEVAVSAGGIYYIRLSDGKGWDFAPPISKGKHDDLKSSSNILYTNNRIYFTSSEAIYCLDTNGKVIWEQRFPDNTGSTITLNRYKQNIYLINKGIDFNGDWTGTPFISAYDALTGIQKYFHPLELEQRIIEPYIFDSSIILYSKGIIHQFDLLTGARMVEKKTKGTVLEAYDLLINPNDCIVLTGGKFEPVTKSYPPGGHFLMNNAGTLYHTNAAFDPVDTIPEKNWWQLYLGVKDIELMRGAGESLIIRNNKKTATLKTTTAFIIGDKLVDITEHEIKTIRLANLL